MGDERLVEAARAGDDRAFAVLVRAHERALYCTAYSILGSSWDASDAVQDAFLEAYVSLTTLRDVARFRAWIARILVNRCYDALGRRRRLVPVAEPTEPAAGGREAHDCIGSDAQLDLFRAVRALDEAHRTVVALRYFQDLKVDDIAAILAVPSGTVKSRINRALSVLATSMDRGTWLEVNQ